MQTSEIAKKSNSYNSKSKYNAHTHPLFRRFNLRVKDIFMLNILKVYYKYQEKSLPSYTANMFSVATYASNYNLGVTKSLTNVHTKTINDDKCIRSDLPKVSMIKWPLFHIEVLLSILKGSPLENTTRIVTYRTVMYVNNVQTDMFISNVSSTNTVPFFRRHVCTVTFQHLVISTAVHSFFFFLLI